MSFGRLCRIAFTAIVSLFIFSACWYHVPDAEQDDVFPCENDRHCIEGYLCRNGFCTSQPPPKENPPAELATEEPQEDPQPQEELIDNEEEIASYCGNGRIDGVEECDDGDSNSDTLSGACRSHCAKAWCGDGVLDPGEACDDGNAKTDRCPYGDLECEVCDQTCQLGPGVVTLCGDGYVDTADEACDDGNTVTEVCPYNLEEQDAACLVCTSHCELESGQKHYCGDGIVDEAQGELCDLGYTQLCAPSDPSCETCWQNCTLGQSQNRPPKVVFADIPADSENQFLSGHRGEQIYLDARPSQDPEGGKLAYHWTQTAGSPVLLHDAYAGRASFVAPKTGEPGLEFQLTTTDPSGQSASAIMHVTLWDTDESVLQLLQNPSALLDMTLGQSNPHLDALQLSRIHAAKITQNGRLMLWGSFKLEAEAEAEETSILAVVPMESSDPFETTVFEAPAENMHYVFSRDFDTVLGLSQGVSGNQTITLPHFIVWNDGAFTTSSRVKDALAICNPHHPKDCGAQINGSRFSFYGNMYHTQSAQAAGDANRYASISDRYAEIFLGTQKLFAYDAQTDPPQVCIANERSVFDACIETTKKPEILFEDMLHVDGDVLLFADQQPLAPYAQKPISSDPAGYAWYAQTLYFKPKLSSSEPEPFKLAGHHTYAKQNPAGTSFFTQKHDLSTYAQGASSQLYLLGHRYLVQQSESKLHTLLTLHDLQEQTQGNTLELPKSAAPILTIQNALWTTRNDTLLRIEVNLDGILTQHVWTEFEQDDDSSPDRHFRVHPHALAATAFWHQNVARIDLNEGQSPSIASLPDGEIFSVSMVSVQDGFVLQRVVESVGSGSGNSNSNSNTHAYAAYPLHYHPEDHTLSLGDEDTKIALHGQPLHLDGATLFFADNTSCVLPACTPSIMPQSSTKLEGYTAESAPQNGYGWYRKEKPPIVPDSPAPFSSPRWPILVDITASDLRPIRAFERYTGALPSQSTAIDQKLMHYRDQNSGSLIYRVESPPSDISSIRCFVSSGHCRPKGSLCMAWDAPKPDEPESQLLAMAIDISTAGMIFYDIRASDAEDTLIHGPGSNNPAPFSCEP